MGYKIHEIEKGYYADGEDAYNMRITFGAPKPDNLIVQLAQSMSGLKVGGDIPSSSSTKAAELPTESSSAASKTNASTANKNKKNKKKK